LHNHLPAGSPSHGMLSADGSPNGGFPAAIEPWDSSDEVMDDISVCEQEDTRADGVTHPDAAHGRYGGDNKQHERFARLSYLAAILPLSATASPPPLFELLSPSTALYTWLLPSMIVTAAALQLGHGRHAAQRPRSKQRHRGSARRRRFWVRCVRSVGCFLPLQPAV
jgi:hypothetical protein